ncbi:MAG: hypothetical protein JRF33_23350 [Deltaproteobacteria bacterium]|nr:hypothetical protein [Deltaproteobacteria bacterium]
MHKWKLLVLTLVAGLALGCGNDDEGPDPDDNSLALVYMGMSEGASWDYDVDTGGLMADGHVEVVAKDLEYRLDTEVYKVEFRQNDLLVATRWYEVSSTGMFLLGEEVQEQTQVIERTFLTPVEIIRFPLEKEGGILVQSYTTTSDLEEGGSETHRMDIQGKVSAPVPDGPYEAIHLLHTRTDDQNQTQQFDLYFVPELGFAQFELPEGYSWLMRSE